MLRSSFTVVYDGSSTLGHIISEIDIEDHQLGRWEENPSSGKIFSTKGVLSIEFDKLSNIKRIAIYLNFKSIYKQLVESLSRKYGTLEVEPISVDDLVLDDDMIGSLKFIHMPGHTPDHILLYYKKDKLLLDADSIYKHVFGAEGMYISAPEVSMDPTTAIVSAQRLSKVNFDKLLMAHQDSPLLEGLERLSKN